VVVVEWLQCTKWATTELSSALVHGELAGGRGTLRCVGSEAHSISVMHDTIPLSMYRMRFFSITFVELELSTSPGVSSRCGSTSSTASDLKASHERSRRVGLPSWSCDSSGRSDAIMSLHKLHQY
jgi:hypothetical protein